MTDSLGTFAKAKSFARKALKWYLWAMAVSIVLGLIGMALPDVKKDKASSGSSESAPLEQPTEPNANPTKLMPDFTGLVYSQALAEIDKLGLPYPDYIDLLESRGIWDDDNWVVRDQLPPSGAVVKEEDRICLGVVKVDENWRDNLNQWSCWYDVTTSERDALDIEFPTSENIEATVLNQSAFPVNLQVVLGIEIDSPAFTGIELMLRFCTSEKVPPGNSVVPMRLTPGDLLEQYDSEQWLLYGTGKFRFEVKDFQKNAGSSCDERFAPFSEN